MSIYSANRMGSMTESTIVANEAYSASDIGRILYESQVNDQAIFEASLASDFAEMKGLREGTLLESEIAAFSEAAKEGFFAQLKRRLKAFWEKVKGVFKSIIAKIAYFVSKDGKKFAKEFEAKFDKNNFKGTIENATVRKAKFDVVKTPNAAEMEQKIRAFKGQVDKTAILGSALGASIGGGSYTPEEFKEKAKEMIFTTTNITAGNVGNYTTDMLDDIKTGKDLIKGLKQTEDAINKQLKAVETSIDNAAKAAAKDKKDDKKDDNATDVAALVSVYENATSIIMGTKIAIVKASMKNSYKLLNTILRMSKKKSLKEAAGDDDDDSAIDVSATVAEDRVDEVLDTPNTDIETDAKSEVEEIVANADLD